MSWDVVDLEQRLAATIPPRSKQLSLASSRHELHVLWHLCTPMRRVLENRYVKVALQLLIAGRNLGGSHCRSRQSLVWVRQGRKEIATVIK